MNKSLTEINLDKAARIALLVLLQSRGRPVDKQALAKLCNVNLRSIERDFHHAQTVNIKLAELLRDFNRQPGERLYTVRDAANILHMSEYNVRLLAKKYSLGQHTKSKILLTDNDLQVILNRPNARKRGR